MQGSYPGLDVADTKEELASLDALETRASSLRSDLTAQRETLGTAADVDTLAGLCETLWRQLKSIELLVHELLIHGEPRADDLAPQPTDSLLACVSGGLAQVVGVMSNEHALEVARARPLLANALGCRALDSLDEQIAGVTAAHLGGQPGFVQQ